MKEIKIAHLNPPCTKDCPNRKLGCHSQCGAYISFREEADNLIRERHETLRQADYFTDRHLKYLECEARRKKRGRK